jgi:hypothetical protein
VCVCLCLCACAGRQTSACVSIREYVALAACRPGTDPKGTLGSSDGSHPDLLDNAHGNKLYASIGGGSLQEVGPKRRGAVPEWFNSGGTKAFECDKDGRGKIQRGALQTQESTVTQKENAMEKNTNKICAVADKGQARAVPLLNLWKRNLRYQPQRGAGI